MSATIVINKIIKRKGERAGSISYWANDPPLNCVCRLHGPWIVVEAITEPCRGPLRFHNTIKFVRDPMAQNTD